MIEEFLDDQLDAEQLALFRSHFLCTKGRQEKLEYLRAIRAVAARQMKPESATGKVINFPATQTWRSFFVGMNRSSYLKLAAAILIVGSAGFLVWRYALRPSQSASLVALNRAYASGRTLETRIGGLDFAPYAPTRGANDADANARILRERAERIVLDAYAEHPTAANRHALGKYYLADKQFDKAIEQFNAALKETPTVAELHNDLGAALLEKSKLEKRSNQPGDSLQHMAASLESIEQALKLQPNYPAAVFNRALCLQEMYLPRQAIEEWKKYLQLDGKSPWADEARRRLAELEKAPSKISKSDKELYQEYLKDPANDERAFDLFCQSYSTTGNGITERLIDDYLAAQSHGDAAATNKLNLLEQLGKLIYQRTTDPYVRDVASYYRQLPPRLLPKLMEARWHLNQGRDLRSTSQSQAVANYEQAIALFRQAQNQCEVKMTTCLLARSHLRQSNLNKSRELFEYLVAPENSYLWIRGESMNGLAEYYQEQGRLSESIDTNQDALSLAEKINGTGLKFTGRSNLAKLYSDLGDWEHMLFYQEQTLNDLSKGSTRHQYWSVNVYTAIDMASFGFKSAAIAYQQEALSIELTAERPLQLSRTYVLLGAILGQEGRMTEAITLLKKAINIGASQGNDPVGIEIQALSWLYLAKVQRKSGYFDEALSSYNRAINFYQQLNVRSEDFEIYRGKALTEIAMGSTVSARQDLALALAVFERNRYQIFAAKERATFFDKEYEIYDVAIGFAYTDNPRAAFDLSEKGRARSLLEILEGPRKMNSSDTTKAISAANRAQPVTSQIVQRWLPGKTSLLEFSCLSDRLLIWGISADGFTHSQSAIPLPLLQKKVNTFLQALTRKTPAEMSQIKELSAELYQILIEPLEPFLAKSET
ncbi:MAG: tetratricopeptide repeat protein, partial [Acidobacteria bacterium]|nr:tetratricopeptide repeat protein [Acidobacteriota bacterium]